MADLRKGQHVRVRAADPADKEVLLVVSYNHPIIYATRGDGIDGVGEVLLWRDEVEVVIATSDGWVAV
ncbi:unnamed protein product [Sphagnum balticum]